MVGRKLRKRFSKDFVFAILVGLISGFLLSNTFLFLKWRSQHRCHGRLSLLQEQQRFLAGRINVNPPSPQLKLVLICVLTTRQHLETRALAIYRTWARNIMGSVIFFTGGADNYTGSLPVIVLDNVIDGEYPPRHKSFAMLQYVSRNYVDRYRWFMRVDDDTYLYERRLAQFLMHVDDRKSVYMGHPGSGTRTETGHLGLYEDAPYCMGGTGIVLSRAMLRSIAGRLEGCLNSTVSHHEDTELGRCIYKYRRISCTRAKQFESYFHQNYHETSGKWTDSVRSSDHLTRHPIKNVSYIYKNYVTEKSIYIRELDQKLVTLRREVEFMSAIITKDGSNEEKGMNLLKSLNSDVPWSIELSQNFYSFSDSNLKESSTLRGRYLTFQRSRRALVDYVRENSDVYPRLRFYPITYLRVNPRDGLQHIIITRDANDVIVPFLSRHSFEGVSFRESNISRNNPISKNRPHNESVK